MGAILDQQLRTLTGALPAEIRHPLFGDDDLYTVFRMVHMGHHRYNAGDEAPCPPVPPLSWFWPCSEARPCLLSDSSSRGGTQFVETAVQTCAVGYRVNHREALMRNAFQDGVLQLDRLVRQTAGHIGGANPGCQVAYIKRRLIAAVDRSLGHGARGVVGEYCPPVMP